MPALYKGIDFYALKFSIINNMKYILTFFIIFFAGFTFAQADIELDNWQHLDPIHDKVYGVSTNKLYQNIKEPAKQTVVVAVIDSGVDIEHEDLKDKIWINQDEIPGNGKDDDLNGYTDDFNGWNFIGGKNGEPVIYDTYEITRLYIDQRNIFENIDASTLKGKPREAYDTYLERKETIEKGRQKAEKQYEETVQYEYIINTALSSLKDALGEDELSKENVMRIDDSNNMSLRNC